METTRITVFERPDVRIVYLPELQSMMMEHLGSANERDYKDAFMALPTLWHEYPWKVSISNELHMKNIPTSVRIWMATKYGRRPEVKELMQKNAEVVNIKSQNAFAAAMASIFHNMLERLTGLKLTNYTTEEEAFAYLKQRYGAIMEVV